MPKKIIRKQVVEQRNACDIDLVEEEIEMVKGPAKRIQTYRVLTTKMPRRIVQDRIGSLSQAQKIADQHSSPPK